MKQCQPVEAYQLVGLQLNTALRGGGEEYWSTIITWFQVTSHLWYVCCGTSLAFLDAGGKIENLQQYSVKSMVRCMISMYTFETVKLPNKTDLPLLILYMTNLTNTIPNWKCPQLSYGTFSQHGYIETSRFQSISGGYSIYGAGQLINVFHYIYPLPLSPTPCITYSNTPYPIWEGNGVH